MVIKNKKYEDILNTARTLFWKHGFRRVSIEEICQKADVSKMTFYRFFPNKVELARNVFDREAMKGVVAFRTIMQEDSSPAEKMNRIMLLKFNGTNDISQEFLMDFYNNPGLGLKDHIEDTSRKMWLEILEDFKKAQESGFLRRDFKPELIGYLSQKMMEMINDENLVKLYSNPQDMIMELASFFVYGMSPHA